MSSYTGQERRRSQRVPYPFEIWYRDRNKGNQGFKHAYGKDLSEHGLLFETYESFSPCTILEIRLELPASDDKRSFTSLEVTPTSQWDAAVPRGASGNEDRHGLLTGFNILAEVVRAEEIKRQWLYHIGISFCKIGDDCRRLIKEYTSSQLNELPRQELVNTV